MSFSIYHCGHCGSLFPAEIGHDEERRCSFCHQLPGTGGWTTESEKEDPQRQSSSNPLGEPVPVDAKVHRGSGKRTLRNVMLWGLAIWALLIGSTLWLHRQDSNLDLGREISARKEGHLNQERDSLLEVALPECHRSLLGFLTAGNLRGRSRFVADSRNTFGKMEGFYRENPLPQVDASRVRRTGQEVLSVGDEWMVRTRWQEGEDGDRFDAVFRRESGVWVLDWEHFSRFSANPWKSFLSGENSDKGEFRLLAKEILTDETTGGESRFLRFVLLSPEDASDSSSPIHSPKFEIKRHSEEGLLLGAAFAANREGGGPFGGAMKSMDPEGLIRVRVTARRNDIGGVRKFELGRVIAGHWIDSDEPGFDMEKLKEEAFGPN